MERLISVLIGYAFGLIQTGYLYGRTQKVDIRSMGSGNAGATNALRTLGWKAGAVTFLGDALKCVLAVGVVRLLFRGSCEEILPVLSMYAGLGATLGHNYPFYMGFKGGKGIAVIAGIIISTTNFWSVLLCAAVFVVIVAATRYVSVGSLAVVLTYFAVVIALGQTGDYGVETRYLYEIYGIAGVLAVSAFYKHKENIKRLLSGTENKISIGKK